MNIGTAIAEGTKILKEKLIITASIDSEILMANAIKKDREYILINLKENIDKEKIAFYKQLIKQRSYRKPVAQLINKKFFWNSEFYVNTNTLIPRPDTELIIEHVLKLTKHKNKLSILDIGTGSGCIMLSILKERKNFYGTGIDISKESLNVSKINARKLGLTSRSKFFKTNVDKFGIGKYDLIVSNPPYICSNKIKYLEKDVGFYEPKLALDGGLDGLSEIRKVIKKSSELIKKNGKLVLEIGFDQKNKVIDLLKKEGFYINSALKDLAKNYRCIESTKI